MKERVFLTCADGAAQHKEQDSCGLHDSLLQGQLSQLSQADVPARLCMQVQLLMGERTQV